MTRILIALAILLAPSLALADGYAAQFSGMTTQVPIDLDGDGHNGRSGYLPFAGSLVFDGISVGLIDTRLGDPTEECQLGTIVPSGYAMVVAKFSPGFALIEIDPAVVECLSFDSGVTSVVEAIVTDAGGSLIGMLGSRLRFTLVDQVLAVDADGYPTVVMTKFGTMTVL